MWWSKHHWLRGAFFSLSEQKAPRDADSARGGGRGGGRAAGRVPQQLAQRVRYEAFAALGSAAP
jgi:hypothetical protein